MNDHNSSSATMFSFFLAGSIVGGSVALLLAPRSGAEMREELRCRMNAVRDRLRTPDPDGEDRESASA